MNITMTSSRGVNLPQATPPFKDAVTEVVTKGVGAEDGNLAAVVGGVISAALLLLIGIMAALLWLMSRQKGSYDTNEADDVEDGEEDSDGSDPVQQLKEPLTIREEEEGGEGEE